MKGRVIVLTRGMTSAEGAVTVTIQVLQADHRLSVIARDSKGNLICAES